MFEFASWYLSLLIAGAEDGSVKIVSDEDIQSNVIEISGNI